MFRDISLKILNNSELISILFTCLCAFFAIFFGFKIFKDKDEEKIENNKQSYIFRFSSKERRLYKKDYFWITVISVMFLIVSIWQLGSTKIPNTTWQPSSNFEQIIFEVEDTDTAFDTVYAIGNEGSNNSNVNNTYQIGMNDIQLVGSNDMENWTHITMLSEGSIMQYQVYPGNWNFKYVSIICQNQDAAVTELAFKKTGVNQFLKLKVVSDTDDANPYNANLLIDETDKIPFTATYLSETYFDEIYHTRNAYEIANGEYMYASVHPLLGTTIIAIGIKIFGYNPLGWRIMGVLFSTAMLPLMYLILKRLFNNRYLSVIGTTLFAAEFMHLTTARIGTLEPFSIFFIMLMYFFMIKYFETNFNEIGLKKPLLYLLLSGISMGLAISTKWTGCYAAVGLAIILFTHWYFRYQEFLKSKKYLKKENKFDNLKNKELTIRKNDEELAIITVKSFKSNMIKLVLCCCVFFVVIPAIIYWASYIPTHVWKDGYSIVNVWNQNLGMYSYHANLEATHPFQSTWYQWIFDLRPIWYYSKDVNGVAHTISCFNNPLINWIGIICIGYSIYDVIKNKTRSSFIILIGYFSALVPWMAVTRCVFSYHYYPAIPFLIMAIVNVANILIKKDERYKKIITGFTIACVVLFVLFLPVTAGFGTNIDIVNKSLKWFESWYFG